MVRSDSETKISDGSVWVGSFNMWVGSNILDPCPIFTMRRSGVSEESRKPCRHVVGKFSRNEELGGNENAKDFRKQYILRLAKFYMQHWSGVACCTTLNCRKTLSCDKIGRQRRLLQIEWGHFHPMYRLFGMVAVVRFLRNVNATNDCNWNRDAVKQYYTRNKDRDRILNYSAAVPAGNKAWKS